MKTCNESTTKKLTISHSFSKDILLQKYFYNELIVILKFYKVFILGAPSTDCIASPTIQQNHVEKFLLE